ncbi:MAG: lytic murein transglycosylase [Caldimicrobium sp.]
MKSSKLSNLILILIILGSLLLGVARCRGNDFSNSTEEKTSCLNELSEEVKPYAQNLIERVKGDLKDKVPKDYIFALFCREELYFTPVVMIRSLTWKEAKLPYHQFLEENRILRAREFMENNKELLDKIEEVFGVEKEVIVAIFLVETDLGRKTGNFPVFNTFFSLALTGEENLFKNFIENSTEIDFSDERVRARWKRRAEWAYKELLYFIEISYKNKWDPFSIKGSIFGAFGYPQFVPKSYLIYGYDWDGDGKVDLFSLPDALASIANYLKSEGYKKEGDREHKKRIIMKYNISEPYAETILNISEILKKNP